MGRVGLTPRARRDLDEIAAFTNERWGAAQRRRYLTFLGKAMKGLAVHPARGRLRTELEADLARSVPDATSSSISPSRAVWTWCESSTTPWIRLYICSWKSPERRAASRGTRAREAPRRRDEGRAADGARQALVRSQEPAAAGQRAQDAERRGGVGRRRRGFGASRVITGRATPKPARSRDRRTARSRA